jgi:hypothetical protein
MADITIDMTGDTNGEPDSTDVDICIDQHALSDYHMRIAGLSLLLNYDQLEGIYKAVKPWFEEE